MGIWRSNVKSSIENFIADHSIHGGDHACFESSRNEDFVQQVACRCFAIGTSYADDSQLTGRKAMKCRSKPGQRMTRIFKLNIWGDNPAYVLVSYNRHRAIIDRFGDIVMPICVPSAHGYEKVAGFNCAAIYGNSGNFNIGNAWRVRKGKINEQVF